MAGLPPGSQSALDPWSCVPIKNFKFATNCKSVSLCGKGATSISTEFANFPNIEALWISDNKLTQLNHLDANFRIKEVYAERNEICTLRGSLAEFKFLNTLVLSHNRLRDVDRLLETLSKMRFLKKLDLRNNPVVEEPDYRLRMIFHLPQVTVLDASAVQTLERIKASETVPLLKGRGKGAGEGTMAARSSAPSASLFSGAPGAPSEGGRGGTSPHKGQGGQAPPAKWMLGRHPKSLLEKLLQNASTRVKREGAAEERRLAAASLSSNSELDRPRDRMTLSETLDAHMTRNSLSLPPGIRIADPPPPPPTIGPDGTKVLAALLSDEERDSRAPVCVDLTTWEKGKVKGLVRSWLEEAKEVKENTPAGKDDSLDWPSFLGSAAAGRPVRPCRDYRRAPQTQGGGGKGAAASSSSQEVAAEYAFMSKCVEKGAVEKLVQKLQQGEGEVGKILDTRKGKGIELLWTLFPEIESEDDGYGDKPKRFKPAWIVQVLHWILEEAAWLYPKDAEVEGQIVDLYELAKRCSVAGKESEAVALAVRALHLEGTRSLKVDTIGKDPEENLNMHGVADVYQQAVYPPHESLRGTVWRPRKEEPPATRETSALSKRELALYAPRAHTVGTQILSQGGVTCLAGIAGGVGVLGRDGAILGPPVEQGDEGAEKEGAEKDGAHATPQRRVTGREAREIASKLSKSLQETAVRKSRARVLKECARQTIGQSRHLFRDV
uniref:U2A'/phosphoprotein 32 family A C-terminal domain-containing protein n=1 Tax=Chromera velia CCMP2878 TaxID=1169474 RepID=A0A0G4FER7_9ALVE|eukprot:Cvel_3256.t1-p1 / transcript=Cvel_3256.t1 / gene=Cvel_3256 / organism=Chromera_velia_CCMP2878 / gene_product=U2 small nuclear ribonucleoprotein A', putative / transcript_product=U2 small nuclear ribonucleoprotein A', putative / location=Cvel_scaffold128:862-7596(-) / protein_length=721 / sequence_SO=supercontig / SO=protein_coding / is_pseudo=false